MRRRHGAVSSRARWMSARLAPPRTGRRGRRRCRQVVARPHRARRSCWRRPDSAAASSTRSTTGRTTSTWWARWAACLRSRSVWRSPARPAGGRARRRRRRAHAHGRVRHRRRLRSAEPVAPAARQRRARFHRRSGDRVARALSFAGVAAACGYASALQTSELSHIAAWLELAPADGARFACLFTRTGTRTSLPRPAVTPVEVKERLAGVINPVASLAPASPGAAAQR